MTKKARVKIGATPVRGNNPVSVKKGEVIQIKTLFSHKMETGLRRDKKTDEPIPRKIIHRFECRHNGKAVFSADLHPAVSANPYISFYLRPTESGPLEFQWTEDGGKVTTLTATLKVE